MPEKPFVKSVNLGGLRKKSVKCAGYRNPDSGFAPRNLHGRPTSFRVQSLKDDTESSRDRLFARRPPSLAGHSHQLQHRAIIPDRAMLSRLWLSRRVREKPVSTFSPGALIIHRLWHLIRNILKRVISGPSGPIQTFA
ncbi:MAG: hypothetical protein ACLFPA_12685, partial [Dichotomicrobium sp.]